MAEATSAKMTTKSYLRTLTTDELREMFADEAAERAWLIGQLYRRNTAKEKAAAPVHPPYKVMISKAIQDLREHSGSSRQAIKKYIDANYEVSEHGLKTQFNRQIRRLVDQGYLVFTNGPNSRIKLSPEYKADLRKAAAARDRQREKKIRQMRAQ